MEEEYRCKFCAEKPQSFALAAIGKIPLCPADADKFVSSARVRPTLYPISAINFIDSEADMPAYIEKMKGLNRGSEIVEQLLSDEDDKFQSAMQKLQSQKEEMSRIVIKEYDTLLCKLRSLHSSIASKLVNCKNDIHIAKETKDAMLSSFSQSVVDSNGGKSGEFYAGIVKDVCRQTQQAIQSTAVPADADQYLQSLLGHSDNGIVPGAKHARSPSDSAETSAASPPNPSPAELPIPQRKAGQVETPTATAFASTARRSAKTCIIRAGTTRTVWTALKS